MKRFSLLPVSLITVVCALVVLVFGVTGVNSSLNRAWYDFSLQYVEVEPNNSISVIAFDEPSLSALGRWPWSRDKHALLIDQLSQGGVKAIGKTVFFLEPQQDDRLDLLDQILETPSLYQLQTLSEEVGDDDLRGQLQTEVTGLFSGLLSLREQLDIDRLFARSVENNGDVILPMHVAPGKQLGNPDYPLPPALANKTIRNFPGEPYIRYSNSPVAITGLIMPIGHIADSAAGIGHLNVTPDSDGKVRSTALLVDYYGELLPSMAVEVVRQALNLNQDDVVFRQSQGLKIGNLEVNTDQFGRIRNVFYPSKWGRPPFEIDSYVDVLTGRIPPTKYSGKIVLLGATAAGIGDTQVTATDANMQPVIALAHTISNLLNEDYIRVPEWGNWLAYGLLSAIAIYLIFINRFLLPQVALIVSSVMLLLIMGTQYYMLTSHLTWLPLMAAVVFLLLGHASVTAWLYFKSEREKNRSHAETAESNRLLGLSFQGQGQLDMAFEKLQKCPLDDSVMNILYNLAIDFERKRQFGKAAVVYEHMATFDSDFRDIVERKDRALNLENTVILGNSAAHADGPGESLILDQASLSNPMLGRYEVERELGKGAMGIVYQGKDPQIGRVVAIKTMSLMQEFEAESVEQVTERFFREAETAGKLRHPNIVTVYDAGSEHDLAYIAMEFLEGYELTKHAKKDGLLPLNEVFQLLIELAEALDYAHERQVVHRDIKPSNVMYNPETKHATITDFGIARVVDASKTKTGTVLGTPSYMSPEQFKGLKADGRADIFALGVMSYQMLTGQLPFTGDSLVSLMRAIAEEPFPDPMQIRPELPDMVNEVLHNALAKDREERYERASFMAEDLKQCLEEWLAEHENES